jgi:transcriptional regulator with XRE-family HTH domain
MTGHPTERSGQTAGTRASDLIARQVKHLRGRRGLTVKQLAARCQELGAGELTANVLTNIEVRRRDVSADELLVLALALDVAPTHLLTPPPEDPIGLAITPRVIVDPETVGRWIRGDTALPPSNARLFLDYAAARAGPSSRRVSDHAAAVLRAHGARLASQYESEAQQFLGKVREQVSDLVTYLEESVTGGVPPEDLVEVLQSVRSRVRPAAAALDTGPDLRA